MYDHSQLWVVAYGNAEAPLEVLNRLDSINEVPSKFSDLHNSCSR